MSALFDHYTVTELSLLVITGLAAATYSKTEGVKNSLVAALIGVATAVVVALVAL